MKLAKLLTASFFVMVAAFPVAAQQAKTADGLVINLGLMSAEQAIHAEGHRDLHPDKFPSGSQHVLITLAQESTGRRLGDAVVVVEVIDPKGKAERKPLLRTRGGGLPDYSELFVFGWSGKYLVRVSILPPGSAKPVRTSFTVHRAL